MRKRRATESKETEISTSQLRWLVMFPCVVLAVIIEHYFHGWGRSVLTTTALSAGTVAVATRLWRYWWFWFLVLALTTAQCFFIVRFRPVLNELDIFSWFAFAVVEALTFLGVIAIAVSIVGKRHPEII